MYASLAGEAVKGPLTSAPHLGDTDGGGHHSSPLGMYSPLGFPLGPVCDETFRHAFDLVRVIDGQQIQPNVVISHPYVSIIKYRLYQVTRNTQTREEMTQLLVRKCCWEMLFQAVHYNRMAGHKGEIKH